MKYSVKVGSEQTIKLWVGDLDHCMDSGIVFRIRDYWKIQKVMNGPVCCCVQSFIRTDSPDGGTDIVTLVRRVLAEVCTTQCF